MAQDNVLQARARQNPIWFNVLLLLDAFALGGLAVWRLVLSLLASKMVDPLPPAAIDAFTGIDHTLFPYWFGHTVTGVLLVWLTAGAFLWIKTRWKLVPAVTPIIPVALAVWFIASRASL